ncbi:hypothetical protein CYLTODRAFT_420749 [Cylindrobasidium torrendii FP15055 ss-10]|uniref:Transcription initiation factor TFIID subunit 2 n=1 Tax=Cylindrobasidium torrendii FP15055 ss-10 TaxID=1314674 RepID=A0A0D7BI71_9AGAR|nr:hypothetical protein CYLTODRAFT_420749 [Cylindrobasidium torrendii FP15055 ss-10]
MDSRQREQTRRGFTISHQKVVAEIDFTGGIWGYTEITITPTSNDLKTVFLNSRHCTIHSVLVASRDADFACTDPVSNVSVGSSMEEAKNSHNHPELKRKLFSAFQEGDDGELAISIPKEVALKQPANPFGLPSEAPAEPPKDEFANIVLKISYSCRRPPDGIEFILPDDSYPYRVPHCYTTPSSPDAARCWVPCFDSISEKCTWEFEFVVPRYLEEIDTTLDEEPTDLSPTLVICSGELVEQVAHPYNSHKTIFTFSQAVLTSVQHIAWAAGPFHLLTIPPDPSPDEITSNSSQPPIYAFCLPGHESWLSTTTSVLRAAMTFYTSEYHSYPFGSYKAVFVDELPVQRFDASTMSIMTVDILHGEDAIEQAIESRQVLGHALACQWAGINIQPKAFADTWLVNGLALYINGLFMRKLLGNNEYRFKMKKDMQRVLERDNGQMPPICQPQVYEPPDPSFLPFFNLKAPLVLHLLDRRLGKSGTSLGLSRVLPKVFLSAISGEMVNNVISTHSFLRTCRKVSGVDLRTFAEQWIYGSGCPSFGVSASFNRKKMAVEITMRQESPAWKAHEGNEVSKLLFKPVPFFEGTMTIRIHEADGTPYEHVLDIRSPFKRYEVPFNTKYKRVRRNTKRYLARQAAAQAAAEGDAEAAEAMGMIDMGFGLDIWEKEKERENWKVADWTEEDENNMSGATYEWIRMDADFEWIANLNFEQSDFMWVSQLQRDRDVVAQLEALHALAKQPTAIVSSTLTRTVLVSNYHHRIRCEAASCLVNCAIRKLDFLGLFHLFKLFLRYCYEPEDANQDLFTHKYIPKPNDFSDLSEYFVRKTLIVAISKIRFENGKSPSVVRQFLVDQLKFNDNTANPYSDAFYICTLITAGACATVSTAPPERGELLPTETRTEHNEEDRKLLSSVSEEIERYLSMDRLIPSAHNIVTMAVLEFYLILGVAGLIPNTQQTFFTMTRYGNYTPVRLAAFDGLFLTKWYAPPIMKYVLAVMAHDSSRMVRRHVARSACQSLAILVQMGEIKASVKENESLLIEEDGSMPEKSKEAKKNELDAMIRALRKEREIGKNEVLREFIMAIATAPDVDYEVRWSILKLADILIRAVNEEPPKLSLHLPAPATPSIESAPVLPKVSIKPPRRPSIVSTSDSPSSRQQSPSVSLSLPPRPKIKLTTNGISTPRERSLSRPASPLPQTPSVPTPTIRLAPSRRPATPLEHTPRQSRPQPESQPSSSTPSKPPPPSRPRGRPPKSAHVNGNGSGHANGKPREYKEQSGGMSVRDVKASRNALKKIMGSKFAPMFLQPVDPIRDQAPSYFSIIKDPMDLGTMSAKLSAGMYRSRDDVAKDFRLMVANAKLYNQPGSLVHKAAIDLELAWEKQWTVINRTLQDAEDRDAAQVIPPSEPSPPPAKKLPPVPIARFSPPPHPSPIMPAKTGPSIKLKLPVKQEVKPKELFKERPKDKGKEKQKEAEPPLPKLKLAIRPPAPVAAVVEDPPPPPYVDDGSADLLEEVLAIEREKEEDRFHQKRPSTPTPPLNRPRIIVNGSSSNANGLKRKVPREGDDIMASASPSKKHASTPSSSTSSVPPGPSSSRVILPPKANKPMLKIRAQVKPNGPGTSTPPTGPSRHTSPAPKPSLKGKEPARPTSRPMTPSYPASNTLSIPPRPTPGTSRSTPAIPSALPAPLPPVRPGTATASGRPTPKPIARPVARTVAKPSAKPPAPSPLPKEPAAPPHRPKLGGPMPKAVSSSTSTPINVKKVKEAMKIIQRLPEASIFARPVDPILDGAPSYLTEISHPMDFGTMLTKLTHNEYQTMEQFGSDFDLTMANCLKYNPPTTMPHEWAKTVAAAWADIYPKLVERKLPYLEKRYLSKHLKELLADPTWWLFHVPVDPILLGIPEYHNIIPKDKARDLSLLKKMVDTDQYENMEDFDRDCSLMVNNATKFNGEASDVGQSAIALRRKLTEVINGYQAEVNKKRKETDTPKNSQPAKRARV